MKKWQCFLTKIPGRFFYFDLSIFFLIFRELTLHFQ